MNEWQRLALAVTKRLIRFPIIPERKRYPAHDELWLQPRGTGPRPAHWLGIMEHTIVVGR